MPDGSPSPVGRLLLVDDEPMVVDVLARLLRRRGYQVDTALDGAEALRLARARTYDWIISDVRMPNMDGPAFIRALDLAANGGPRVVFVTGFSDFSLSDAQALGVVAVLEKPAQVRDLLDLIAK